MMAPIRQHLNSKKKKTNLVLTIYTTGTIARSALSVSGDIPAPLPTGAVWIHQIVLALAYSYVLLLLPLVPSSSIIIHNNEIRITI
jgi:hypothetical protein